MMVKCAPRLATILCLYKHKASQQASKRRGRVFSVLIPTSYTTKRASSHLVGQVGNANTVGEGRSHCAQERCRAGDEGGEERGGGRRRRRGDRERDNDGRGGQIPVVATLGGVCFCLLSVAAMRALPFRVCHLFHCHGPSLCRTARKYGLFSMIF